MRTVTLSRRIVCLILKHHLTPHSTIRELFNWYNYSIANGMTEFIGDEEEITAFADWVRLKKVPRSLKHALKIYDGSKDGPALFVANCVSPNLKTLLELRRRILNKNKDHVVWCHHNRKKDKIITRRNNVSVGSVS